MTKNHILTLGLFAVRGYNPHRQFIDLVVDMKTYSYFNKPFNYIMFGPDGYVKSRRFEFPLLHIDGPTGLGKITHQCKGK